MFPLSWSYYYIIILLDRYKGSRDLRDSISNRDTRSKSTNYLRTNLEHCTRINLLKEV